MNASNRTTCDDVSELRAALEVMLSEHFGRPLRVDHFERRPFAYQTSSAIEAIDVELDGTRLKLLLKDLSRSGLQGTALRTKPDFVRHPLREIEVYRKILSDGRTGTARCYGSLVDADKDRYWLLLECVGGRELYQVGERSLWQAVARRLAKMHCQWAGRFGELQTRAPLLSYDYDFYRAWITRAAAFQAQKTQPGPSRWQRLVDGYDRVIQHLLSLPRTFIHGELYASNMLVEGTHEPLRICPVDWEMAAIGPGLMDMAALTAGKWSDEERTALLEAYRQGLEECGDERSSLAELQRDLDYCRLHAAVQWLGWSPDWTPPAAHAHDWRSEAIMLADKIGL
jgi:hypothetical protein